jgi:Ran-binding protein 9/10
VLHSGPEVAANDGLIMVRLPSGYMQGRKYCFLSQNRWVTGKAVWVLRVMRQRKRRKTLRPDFVGNETRLRSATMMRALCVNGVCSANPSKAACPSKFDGGDCAPLLTCAPSSMSAEYDGSGREDKDAAAVRADAPVPQSGLAAYYFEVVVDNAGTTGRVGVGLCEKNVKLDKMPGWELGSYGYHGDDGCTFQENSHNGERYGPKYGTGDVIGCCWDLVDDLVFFTRNGRPLATAFRSLKGVLYPTIGMQTKGGRVTVNFGASPFSFDIESYAQGQQERVLSNVHASPLPGHGDLMAETVLGYLLHAGYEESAQAFAKDSGFNASRIDCSSNGVASPPSSDSDGKPRGLSDGSSSVTKSRVEALSFRGIRERRLIMAKVTEGRAAEAYSFAQEQFPDLQMSDPESDFLLHTQLFIEMLVAGDVSLDAAVEFGRVRLLRFYDKFPAQLEEIFCLLAYKDPVNSPVSHLVGQERRDAVAEKLNEAILESQCRPRRSLLNMIIAQRKAVLAAHSETCNGPAALLRIEDYS